MLLSLLSLWATDPSLIVDVSASSHLNQNYNFETIDRWPYGPGFSVLIEESTIFFTSGGVLQVGEIEPSGKISWLSELFLSGLGYRIAKFNNRLYIAVDDQGISIVDISELTNPVPVTLFQTGGRVFDIAVHNDTVYAAMGDEGLEIYDCLDWSETQLTGSLKGVNLRSLQLADTLLFASDVSTGLRIIDAVDPSSPDILSTLSLDGQHYGLAVDTLREQAYVCSFDGDLNVVDVSDPLLPTYVTTIECFGAWDIELSDSLAYVATWNDTVHVIEIESQSSIGVIDLQSIEVWSYDISLSSNYLALAGFLGTGLLIDIQDFAVLDQWGYGGITQVLDYNEDWIASGMQGGKLVVSPRSDPTDPQYILDLPDWPQDIELTADTIYAALSWKGLGVYCIDPVADSVKTISQVTLDGIHVWDVLKNGNYVYLAGGDSGMVVIDFSDPVEPVVASRLAIGEKVITLSSWENLILIGLDQGGVWEVDVSDPLNPTAGSFHPTFGVVLDMFFDDRYLYVAQGPNGLAVYDASTDNWQLKGSVESENVLFALDIEDDQVFAADGSAGIKAYDMSDPSHPVRIGLYNTGGSARDIVVFNDTVMVADGYDGLWMLRYLQSGITESDMVISPDRVSVLTNPFSDWIRLNKPVEANIYDVYGRKISSMDGDRYDAGNLAPGIYFVTGEDFSCKIVKISLVK